MPRKKIAKWLFLSLSLLSCHAENSASFSTETSIKQDLSVTRLEIASLPYKTTYYEGEYFNRAGLKLKATLSDDSFITPSNAEITITPQGSLTLEMSEVIATYQDVSVSIPISVKELELESLEVSQLPYTTSFSQSGYYAFNGLVITGKVKGGEEREISLEECTLTISGQVIHDQDNINLNVGTYTVFITAYGQSTSFDIQILNGYKLEAENIQYETPSDSLGYVRVKNQESQQYITQANGNGNIRPIADESASYASGGSYLGNINTGNVIDFYFYSSTQEQAEIAIRAASGYMTAGDAWDPKEMSDEQVNRLFDAYANGEKVTISDDVILPGKGDSKGETDPSLWVNWNTVSFGLMSLKAGWNVLSLKITSDYVNYLGYGCSFNLDYLSVDFISS